MGAGGGGEIETGSGTGPGTDPHGRRSVATRPRPGGSPSRSRDLGWTLLAAAAIGGPASADLVAGWNFNDLDPTAGSHEATAGEGSLDLGPLLPIAAGYDGTTMNALDGWKSGDALGFRGGIPEGGVMVLNASLGLAIPDSSRDFTLSFAARRSATGVERLRVDRWSGSEWQPVEEVSMETDWAIETVRISGVGGTAELVLRIAPVGDSGPSGTLRIDNLRLDSVVVPAPAASTVLLGGSIASRAGRRRS